MKIINKKIACWAITIVTLLVATLSPMLVFATSVSDAQQNQRYNSLATTRMLIQAADTCVPKANETAKYVDLRYSDDGNSHREELKKYYNLNFTYDTTTLYSNYLEQNVGSNSRTPDGKVYCSELGNFLINKLLPEYGLYNTASLPSIICGNNNEGGLFKIKVNGEYVSDCKGTFETIRRYTDGDLKNQTSTELGVVWFELNKDFKFSDFLAPYVGDISSVNKEVIQAERYLNFKTACNATQFQGKAAYDSAVSANADNLVEIWHDGKTEYYSLGSPKTTIYANGNVNSTSTTTCAEVAKTLAPSSSDNYNLVDTNKLTQISNCYASAKSNIDKVNEVRAAAEQMYKSANKLYAYADLAQKPQYVYELSEYTFPSAYVNIAGGGSALESFKTTVEEFAKSMKSYNSKAFFAEQGAGEPLTNDELANMRSEITNFKNNVEIFKTNIEDKINNIAKNIPASLKVDPSKDTTLIREEDGNGAIINKVNGFYSFDDSDKLTCEADSTMANIVSQIEGVTGGDIQLTQYTPPSSSSDGSSGSTSSTTTSSSENSISDYCYNAGVEGMSWILCPAMNNMTHTATALEATITNMLSVNSNFYGPDSSTKTAWDLMRNIANVVIIMILLVIIFSQLTGYGIDNYGIKKMLPKLILMAILLNLSFYICELAVDLSNITGEGLRNLFVTISDGIGGGESVWGDADHNIAAIVSTVFTVAGVAGAASPIIGEIVVAASAPTMVMAVIMIVLALLVVIVAILLFFLMLGARMVIVILCIAISPIAFICYILPNTQKLFKRWWTLFESALIIFPLCGAVMGISYIIKSIMVDSDQYNIWMWIIAIFIPFLPFFMLPSLLKGVINGLGSVGGALTSMGGAFRKGIMSGRDAIRGTEAYKAAEEITKRNRANYQSGFKFDRRTGRVEMKNGKPVEADTNRLRRFLAGGTVGIAKAREQALRNEDQADTEANITANTNIYAAQRVKDQNKQTYRVEEAAEGVAHVTSRYARQDAKNRRITEKEKYAEGLEQVSHEYARRTARNERLEKQAKIDELPANARYSTLRQRAANQRMTDQARFDEGTAATNYGYERQLAANELMQQQAKVDVGAPRMRQGYATQMARNDYLQQQSKIDAGASELMYTTLRQQADNARVQTNAEQRAGVAAMPTSYADQIAKNARMQQTAKFNAGAPIMNQQTLETIANNERLMTDAQQRAGVAAINDTLAQNRAEAARDAQELRNATDMYAQYSSADLRRVVENNPTNVANIRTMLSTTPGGTQQAIALFKAAESNGLENEVYTMLGQLGADAGSNAKLMSSFTSSKEKIISAYGKKGANQSFEQFMTDPGNNGLKHYIEEKGPSVIRDLTDKAWSQIERYSNSSGTQIVNTDFLIESANRNEAKESIDIINRILAGRSGETINITGKQLANFDPSTVNTLNSMGTNGQAALIKAANDIRGNTELMSQVPQASRAVIDSLLPAGNKIWS